MRVAFFSPMPPSKSGIADYSAALVDPLSKLVDLKVFSAKPAQFDSSAFDVALYQVGNNDHHSFVYEQALQTPGVVVMHEANLHHLIAEITIKTSDWDKYVREVEYDSGPEAGLYAQRVRALEVGPDYEGVPMLRRLLAKSLGVIAHSRYVESDVRKAGFKGPAAVIPHGAWIPKADRFGYRVRVGVEPSTPLIGIFGFLKPYKRIAESLRAFRRLLRVQPNVKMILVGEPHPEFPLRALIDSLGLTQSVRVLGFTPIEDFVGYIAACDIVLNLRYPTVGESSGTLLRSLGLGKAVLVSDIGSFSEYPDNVCLKVQVDLHEEDTLFEYLNLLVSRPDLRDALGHHARDWVESQCNWSSVAQRYASFLECVVQKRDWNTYTPPAAILVSTDPVATVDINPQDVLEWAGEGPSRDYVKTHLTRLEKTLEMVPPGDSDKRILEMGAYMQITPALRTKLCYGEVRGCYYGPAGKTEHKSVTSESGERFECDIDLFDAEKDIFPYPDGHFDTVLCCELIEHLPSDPMFMMSEINRILKPGGHLVITTPNINSARAIAAILQGYHPGFFPAYIKAAEEGGEADARHAREYAPREIARLLQDSGFELVRLETGEFREEPHPEHAWVTHMLEQYMLDTSLRGDGIYVLAVKRGSVQDRYPEWLYN